jgi:hypothetical protein
MNAVRGIIQTLKIFGMIVYQDPIAQRRGIQKRIIGMISTGILKKKGNHITEIEEITLSTGILKRTKDHIKKIINMPLNTG